MYFNKLKEDSRNPRKKYIAVKKFFKPRDSIKEKYVEESFEFAYSMTFGKSGEHRNHRSGGSHMRKNGEIFANTFQGKLCEFALYQVLKDKKEITKPDLSVYKLGKWDSYDFKVGEFTISVKSTKHFGQLLLLETKDWTKEAEYIPNNNECYDITVMVRLQDDNERIMKKNRLYYSQYCKKEKLWNTFEDNTWLFDIPGLIRSTELKYLINMKYIIHKGDLLNGRTRMDADNYYCHIADMHDIKDLINYSKTKF